MARSQRIFDQLTSCSEFTAHCASSFWITTILEQNLPLILSMNFRKLPRHLALNLTMLLSFATMSHVSAEVYRYTAEDGSTVYSDQSVKGADAKQVDVERLQQRSNSYSEPQNSDTATISYLPDPTANRLSDLSSEFNADEGANSAVTTDGAIIDPNTDPTKLSEKQCQELYGTDCDHLVNWRKYALEACGHDTRCSDEAFLQRKYQPRLLSEVHKIAYGAARRDNHQTREVELFLLRKYTGFCEQQAVQACRSKSSKCISQKVNQCEDPRSLEDFLSQYKLTTEEKKVIIARAKELNSTKNQQDLQRLIGNMVDLIIAGMML